MKEYINSINDKNNDQIMRFSLADIDKNDAIFSPDYCRPRDIEYIHAHNTDTKKQTRNEIIYNTDINFLVSVRINGRDGCINTAEKNANEIVGFLKDDRAFYNSMTFHECNCHCGVTITDFDSNAILANNWHELIHHLDDIQVASIFDNIVWQGDQKELITSALHIPKLLEHIVNRPLKTEDVFYTLGELLTEQQNNESDDSLDTHKKIENVEGVEILATPITPASCVKLLRTFLSTCINLKSDNTDESMMLLNPIINNKRSSVDDQKKGLST